MRSLSLLTLPLALSAGGMLFVATQGPARSSQLPSKEALISRQQVIVYPVTPRRGTEFAGGLMMPMPFAELRTPNITPDKATGIGNWSDDEFDRAMHEGIGQHGEYLYRVFAFPWSTKISRDDVLAIKAYLFSPPAVNARASRCA